MGKQSKKKLNPVIKAEITGLAFLTVAILLFFGLGFLSRFVSGLLMFFVGIAVYPIYLIIACIAVAMMIGRRTQIISLSQKIALGMFGTCALVFIAMIYGEQQDFIPYVTSHVNTIKTFVSTKEITNMSSGILGYILNEVFVALLSKTGTIILFSSLFLISLILFFQRPMRDYYKMSKKNVGEVVKKQVVEKEEDEEVVVRKKPKIYDFAEEVKEVEQPEEEEVEVDFEVDVVVNNGKYNLPPLTLLNDTKVDNSNESRRMVEEKASLLVKTLEEFNVFSKVVAINIGPTVTQFELEIKAGTKLSKLRSLSSEVALALAAKDVRIQAPIPQKSTVGVEIPNGVASLVTLKEIIKAIPKSESNKTIFALGKDIMGKPVYAELNKMPHMLVAGATGSGKSVCINSIIITIAMRAKPDEVKMLMIDPKKVELTVYNGLPHLMAPVVTNPKKAATALQKIVAEMERRYDLFSDSGSKNIESYNQKLKSKNLDKSLLPYIVVIVDELADLMLVASKEVEDAIMRITQMARAAGIHLIVATQRPSTDIITGVIKSNIPSRIAFGVSSSIDSRTILDSVGAEKLLGKGDMLFVPMGSNYPTRIQGAFLSEEEVEKVVHYCSQQQVAQFDEEILKLDEEKVDNGSEDDLYEEVLIFVLENGSASTSLLQRRFRIGYNRASRLIDDLEMNGIIGPQNGSKPREVITDEIVR